MEGNRKLLAAVVFGLLSLAALVLIILLNKFSAEIFTAWITGTAGVFGIYMGANVASKFSPVAKTAIANNPGIILAPVAPPPSGSAAPPPVTTGSQERGGDGLLGISAALRKLREAKKRAKIAGG